MRHNGARIYIHILPQLPIGNDSLDTAFTRESEG